MAKQKRKTRISIAELYEHFQNYRESELDGTDEKYADRVSAISDFLYFIKGRK